MEAGYLTASDDALPDTNASDILYCCLVKLARKLHSYDLLKRKAGCDDQHSTLAGTAIDE